MSRYVRHNIEFENMPDIFNTPTDEINRGRTINEALKIVFRPMEVMGNRPRTIESYDYIFNLYTQYNKLTYVEASLEELKDSTKLLRLKSIKAVLGKFYSNGWLEERFWCISQVKFEPIVN